MRGIVVVCLLVIYPRYMNTENTDEVILSTISDIISQLNSSVPENYQDTTIHQTDHNEKENLRITKSVPSINESSEEATGKNLESSGNSSKKGERRSRQIFQPVVGVPLLWRNALSPQLRILVTPSHKAVQGKQNKTTGPGEQTKLFENQYYDTSNRIVTCYPSNRRPYEGFACDEENCVPLEWVCDGERDCDSGADEANCRTNFCVNGQFRCVARGKHVCLSPDRLCDGHIDCQDGSDEDLRNCHNPSHDYCRDGYFRCRQGQGCIPSYKVCDSEEDCSDGSDEQNCRYPTHQHSCSSDNQFQCYRGYTRDYTPKCIPRRWLCDRHYDCPGGEDELVENCPRSSPNALQRMFRAFLLLPALDTNANAGVLRFPPSSYIVDDPTYK
ncbi:uncharacterized protein [Anabrus simplex]|uniref:uncharacterized protein n=1 Tax=Anabrus simplex TaxID=316456 RepID=UPI0035A26DF9